MPIFKTKTACYYYEKKGNGEPVIFAHGLFVNHSIFDFQINKLKSDYTCYSFDLPGHGRSSYNPEGWTLENIAEDFKQFIDDNELYNPTLVGLSQGGMIFLRLAVKYPEIVGRLVLVGCSHLAEFPERISLWNDRINIFQKGNRSEIASMISEVQRAIVSTKFLENQSELSERELRVMQSNIPEAMVLATKAAVIDRKNVTGLSRISCPTLIVCGTDDHATPKDIAEQMLNGIEKSCLTMIPRAGHHVPIEASNEFYNILNQFLNNNKL